VRTPRDFPLRTATLRFLDIETTGLRPDRGARITEVALIDREEPVLDWRGPAHERPAEKTGPARDPLEDDVLRDDLPRLTAALDVGTVVGHNLSFDLDFIAYEADRLGTGGFTVRFIDTMTLAQHLLDRTARVRLADLLDYFGIASSTPLHRALADARATRALFWQLVDRGRLDTLADAQVQRLHWTSF
jgi:DNA polymerase III epsilon subunit-like protein